VEKERCRCHTMRSTTPMVPTATVTVEETTAHLDIDDNLDNDSMASLPSPSGCVSSNGMQPSNRSASRSSMASSTPRHGCAPTPSPYAQPTAIMASWQPTSP
jgi:hypothetical protein